MSMTIKDHVNERWLSQNGFQEQYFTLNGTQENKNFLIDFVRELKKRPSSKIVKITVTGNVRIARQCLQKWTMYPTVFIGNSESDDISHDNIGICVHVIVGKIDSFEYIVSQQGVVIGSFWTDQYGSYLSVVNVHSNSNGMKDVKRELENIYEKIDDILGKYQMTARDIYRFWNFLQNVARDYGTFNAVRDMYFVKHGIIKYPAATGIESRLHRGLNANICFDACSNRKSGSALFGIIHSDMQCDAWAYGPKFSRAIVLDDHKKENKKVMISGTSSIGKHGASVYKTNATMNVAYTMRSIGHLLKKESRCLDDIVSAFVYVKDDKVLDEFVRLYDRKKWGFPYNIIYTSICRKDLIFEMECIAGGGS